MQRQGKFILFDLIEFAHWLNSIAVNRVIRLVQNHHTWNPAYADFTGNNHFNLLRGMENAHLERGFSEIAQNLTIFPDGTAAVCRSLDKIPAGAKGANTGGICIENVGNFDNNKDAMSDEQRNAIIKVNALLCKRFSLQPNANTIVYHHWYDLNTGERTNGAGSTKSCPGTNFFGGNKVTDAQTSLISLITQELERATDVEPMPTADVLFTSRVTTDSLNVRTEPRASGRKLRALNRGVVVNTYELSDTWYRIHAQESHWVNGRYLERITV